MPKKLGKRDIAARVFLPPLMFGGILAIPVIISEAVGGWIGVLVAFICMSGMTILFTWMEYITFFKVLRHFFVDDDTIYIPSQEIHFGYDPSSVLDNPENDQLSS